METKTNARTKASRAYNEKNYDRLNLFFLKGKKEIYKEIATAAGYKNIGPFIEDLMDTIAAREGYGDRLKAINGGSINRQRKEIAIQEATPEAASVFAEILK